MEDFRTEVKNHVSCKTIIDLLQVDLHEKNKTGHSGTRASDAPLICFALAVPRIIILLSKVHSH